MKNFERSSTRTRFVSVFLMAAFGLTIVALPSALAQSGQGADKLNSNPPPFDFNDAFYTANGINVQELNTPAAQRFGVCPGASPATCFRLTGPPAGPGQINWVIDNSNTDPDRNSVRILATTGGYKDDTGSPTQFISIIAFLPNQNFFTGDPNARGLTLQNIVSNFEAYTGLKQVVGGVFRPTPCASIGDPTAVGTGNCFPVASVATPNLRQDWRFTTNRSAIDGSAPLSYFGDDLLGMWIITYHWYTDAGFGPHQTPPCKAILAGLAQKNGLSLDGTPIIKTGDELHFLEGVDGTASPIPGVPDGLLPNSPCAAEGNLDTGGADGGPVWLICPAIPDATQGAIAPDAFLDIVHKPDGSPLDPQITANFNCLQQTGDFCPLANGTYVVDNQESGLVWDDTGGTQVQLSGTDLTNALAILNGASKGNTQQWTFTANPDGTYTITNAFNGLVLDNRGSSTDSGTQLALASPTGGSSQKWSLKPLNNGYMITNVSSNLAVDATTDTPTQPASIILATPNGESRQIWVIR